jgi:hypothetical protein
MKVLAIVLGSIAGLVLIAIIAIALLAPIVAKKYFADANDPKKEHATAAKIADFTVPPGFGIINAIDFGITQSVTIAPLDRSKYSLIVQLTAQHVTIDDTKTLLDRETTSVQLADKISGCDLKEQADDTIVVRGKPQALRTFTCARTGTPMRVELALIRAKASSVQLVATDVRTPVDHAALVAFVESIR